MWYVTALQTVGNHKTDRRLERRRYSLNYFYHTIQFVLYLGNLTLQIPLLGLNPRQV